MKVAWFTPFNEKSAIGKYSKLATDALSKNAIIDIYAFDTGKLLQTNLRTIQCTLSESLVNKLSEYDIVVYNIGDNSTFHEGIYDILQLKRGIIIIHDATLLGFYYGYYCNCKNKIDEFKSLYEQLYNDSVENAPYRYLSNEGIKYGFMEQITKYCSGIIVHSDFHANIIRKVYNGPLTRIYFPFTQEYLTNQKTDTKLNQDYTKMNMLTVGNVNKNKQVLEVVQAIGKSSLLKNAINYTIIGSQADNVYIGQLKDIANKYNISDNIKLVGYVDDDTLAAYYRDADLLCNLRNPALEGASWSLVEQMSLGKPIIVSDNGFYSEIPDDCVFKISINNEEEDLTNILISIIKNRDALRHKGENAKKLVDLQFNQIEYSQAFLSFTEQIIYSKPIETLLNKLSYVMNQFGITKDMKIVDTLSEQIELIFNKEHKLPYGD